MSGGSGPHTKRLTHHQTSGPGGGPNAPIRLPRAKTPVRKLSSVVPEAVSVALPTVNVVCPPGPVAIEGVESPRVPVPRWVPNLPTHPLPADLLAEGGFAPCHPRRRPLS